MPTTDTKPAPRKRAAKAAKDKPLVKDIVGGMAGQPYYPPQFDPRTVQDWFSSWVYVACNVNATTVAKGMLRMYSRSKTAKERPSKNLGQKQARYLKTAMSGYITEETEEVTDHPFLRLMDYVNPILDRTGLWWLTSVSWQMSGQAYWKYTTDQFGVPCEIWWLPSHRVQPILGKDQVIDGYRFHHRQGYTEYPADTIVHFRRPSPLDIMGGFGDLQGVYSATETNKRMEEFENSLFTNDAQIGLFISPDEDINETQRTQLDTSFQTRYSGWRNSGRPLIAPMKMTVQRLNESIKDLQFPEGRKAKLDEIAAGFGTPVPVILQDAAKYNNMRHGLYLWVQHKIAPMMMAFAETINTRLMPLYDDACAPWNEFDLYKPRCKWFACFDDPVPEDAEADSKVATQNYAGGVWSKNEARALLGYEPVDDGDEFLIPSGVRTQEEIDAQVELAKNPPAQPMGNGPAKEFDPANIVEKVADVIREARTCSTPDGIENNNGDSSGGRGEHTKISDVRESRTSEGGRDGLLDRDSDTVTASTPEPSKHESGVSEAIQRADDSIDRIPEGVTDPAEDRRSLIESCAKRCRVVIGKLNEEDVTQRDATDQEKIDSTLNRWKDWALALLLLGDMTPLTTVPDYVIHELTATSYEMYLKAIARGQALGGAEVAELGVDAVHLNAEQIDQKAKEMAVEFVNEAVASRTADLQNRVDAMTETGNSDWVVVVVATFIGTQEAPLSEMIADTEYARGVNEGATETFAASGIEQKMWIAQAGACEFCAPLHGTIVAVRESFKTGWKHNPSVPTPPLHPNCRCAVAAVVI